MTNSKHKLGSETEKRGLLTSQKNTTGKIARDIFIIIHRCCRLQQVHRSFPSHLCPLWSQFHYIHWVVSSERCLGLPKWKRFGYQRSHKYQSCFVREFRSEPHAYKNKNWVQVLSHNGQNKYEYSPQSFKSIIKEKHFFNVFLYRIMQEKNMKEW